MEKVSLNGVELYPFTSRDQLLAYVESHKSILVAINAEKVVHATDETRSIINRNMGYCDGAGVMRALRQMGIADACKIPGCELWLNIIERFHHTKSFYLVGARQEVIEQTVTKLKAQFPEINILGWRNGYIKTNEERQALIDDICAKQPDVVFVAMGSPKQELLMEEIQQRHQAIFQGLGGSFEVYTGYAQRAPKWWVDHNMEFVYRIIHQPKRFMRLLKAYKFIWWLIIGKFKKPT